MSEPCCYQDPATGKLRGNQGCHGGFEACGSERRCVKCGQTGHQSYECPGGRWPRAVNAVLDWMLLATLSFGLVFTVFWMGLV